MPDLKKVFGAHVRQARKARGFTQAQLAESCEMSLEMIGRMERGEIAPSFTTIEKLSEVLGTPPPVLFGAPPDACQKDEAGAFGRVVRRISKLNAKDLEWLDRVLAAMLRR